LPKVIAKFKCKECQDIFEATSDNFSKCKCGKCSVKPWEYGTSYHRDNNSGKYFEELEKKTYRYQEEYHILEQDFMDIWNHIKEIKEERGYLSHCSVYIYEGYDRSDDGNKFLARLTAEVSDVKYGESTTLAFNAHLDYKHDNEELLDRLQRFYDLFIKIINKDVDINDRTKMKDLSSEWDRTQCELYDYTFYA
jgi:hypothetical protein